MKHLNSIAIEVQTKISSWKKAKQDYDKLSGELYQQSKTHTKMLVQILDILDMKRIKIPVETADDKIFSVIEIDEKSEQDALHDGGADVLIRWMDKSTKKKNDDTLWNLTATTNSQSHEHEGIAVILDYLIRKYPDAIEELKRREDSAKFGI